MKKYITLLLTLLIFTVSCNDYLDVNKDPDVIPTDKITDPKSLLPTAELNIANTLMGWDFGFNSAFNIQYWTAHYDHAQFNAVCQYESVSNATAYQNFTSGALADLKKISALAETTNQPGYGYIAEALSIYTWQIITDVWGDIPYSEAIRGDEGIFHPKFDSGESIYADLLVRVNALSQIDPSNYTLSSNESDFIFNGDFTNWKLFVNSLKLKLMMRLSETNLYDNTELIAFVNANSFLEESAKISGSIWDDGTEKKRHPMREAEAGGANYISSAVIACRSFTAYLAAKNDPRVDKLFNKVDGEIKGAFFGDFDSTRDSDLNGTDDDDEVYSYPIFAPDTDIILISNWEVSFFIAEVNARASNEAAAEMYYNKGISQSLAQHALPTTIPPAMSWEAGKTIEENIEQIALQKWVANANYQHVEAFLERNRTKYPSLNKIDVKDDRNFVHNNFPVGSLTLSVTGRAITNDALPQSAIYPQTTMNNNINAPSQKTNITEKVWWNQKSND